MLYRIFTTIAFVLLKLFFGLRRKGLENIPKKGGFILASNHVSFLDPIVLSASCRRRVNFIARDTLFSNRYFAWLISEVGTFPVKRGSADIGAMKEAIKRLRGGTGLLLFPEGRRKDANIQVDNVEPGAGFLAAKAGVPVIPAFIKGAQEALPKGAKCIRRANISVSFGEEIKIEKNKPYNDAALEIMQGIKRLGL